jgi:conjugative transposon TraM protein
MQNEGTAGPEMAQIESVLEKILDVQHPERVREKLQEESEKRPGKIFSVAPAGNEVQTVVFDAGGFTEIKNNGFIRINYAKHEADQNAVKALIHSTESLQAGSTIKIRLLDDIFLNGELLTHNDFVFGTCDIQGDRLLIKISSILSNGSIFSVNLSAYDLDGQEGLYIPGTVANEASKQMTNQAMQDLQLLSADPSIGAQAASAGIQTAKTLIGKKTRAIKVQVKSGYRIFLKDKNQKQ